MSKLKKISLVIFTVITIAFMLSTTSNATDWGTNPGGFTVDEVKVGDTVRLGHYWAHMHRDLFCIWSGQHFDYNKERNYKAVSKITIEGNTSTDHTGKKVEDDWHNGKLAYIMCEDTGKGSFSGQEDGQDPAQYMVWYYMGDWIKNVGIKHRGLYIGIANHAGALRGSKAQKAHTIATLKKAEEYAKSLDQNKLENKTDKNSIKVQSYEKDGKQYLKVGPFKYNFVEKLSKIELSDNDGHTVSPTIFGQYNGRTFNEMGLNDIQSGKAFYIVLPADGSLNSINRIKVTDSYKVKSAVIVFWKHPKNWKRQDGGFVANWQNIMQFKHSENPKEDVDNWGDIIIDLLGNLKITKKDYDDNKNISDVTFKVNNAKGQYVKQDSNGNISYVEESDATVFKTDSNGEVKIEKLNVGQYTITEIKNPNITYGGTDGSVDTTKIYYNTDIDSEKRTVTDGKITIDVRANLDSYTNLFIYNQKVFVDISGKVWKDVPGGKNNTLDNVLHAENYKLEGDNNIYDGSDVLFEGIKVVLKDKDGNIVSGMEKTTDANGYYKFENVLISELDNYYVEFEYDGLTYTSVKALEIQNSTDTQGNTIDPDSINSKASEVVEERKTLNSGFDKITNNNDNITDRNHGKANGTTTRTITYDNDEAKWKSTFNSIDPDTFLTANTNVASFKLSEQYNKAISGENGALEIPNVNLGLVERAQPNISIRNDLMNVKVQVNGYGYTYTKSSNGTAYGTREEYEETNIAAKFANGSSYTREIYPSDVQYSSTLAGSDDAKKLKVYATYAITVRNTSNTLAVSVPEIVNYYDKNYEIVSDGTEYPEYQLNGVEAVSLNDEDYKHILKHEAGSSVGDYNTSKIELGDNAKIEATKSMVIYVTYRVNDETVMKILGEGDQTLNTVTEVYNYKTYYAQDIEGCKIGDIYAGIDKNSAPGNATPGETNTFEDDTDKAPAFVLTAKGARQIEGTVFEDSTGSEELQTGEERRGDGKYDASENTISGVKVELLNKETMTPATYYPEAVSDDGQTPNRNLINVSGKTDSIDTDSKGYYIFKGIEPDEYVIRFTYANGTTKICDLSGNEIKDITVQDYKSTIINNSVREVFENNDKYKMWYKNDATIRNSDAKDVYEQRQAIDGELETIEANTTSNIEKTSIGALTPYFAIPMEFDSIITDSNNGTFIHRISNIDFGIVERPRQNVTLEKEVTHIKVTLPNGQVLVDGDPNDNLNYVSVTKNNNKIEEIYITMDNELIYGSHVEIEYGLTLTNSSELDYATEEYYYYGNRGDTPITMKNATILDYVDSNITLKAGQEGTWDILDLSAKGYNWNLTPEQEQELLNRFSTVVKAEAIDGNKQLKPGESSTTAIMVERLLSSDDRELVYENNGEVVKVEKTGGGMLYAEIPGSYVPVLLESQDPTPEEPDENDAPPVAIVPPTGLTNNNVLYVIIGTVSLAILGAGTYGVRRFLKK